MLKRTILLGAGLVVCLGGLGWGQGMSLPELIAHVERTEGKVRSGRIEFERTERTIPLPDSYLRQTARSEERFKQLQAAEHRVASPALSQVSVLFDHSLQKIKLITEMREKQHVRDRMARAPKTVCLQTADKVLVYNEAPAPSRVGKEGTYQGAEVGKPNVPLFITRVYQGRPLSELFKKGKSKLLGQATVDGRQTYVVFISRNPALPPVDTKVWIDSTHFVPLKIEFHNDQRCTGAGLFQYQQYSDGLWYPAKIERITYVDLNRPRCIRRVVSEVTMKVELNVKIDPREFEFNLPIATSVQDNRFQPPLIYRQGTKQFGEQELFALHKNPDLARQYEPQNQNRLGLAGCVSVGVGLLLVTFAVLYTRRRR